MKKETKVREFHINDLNANKWKGFVKNRVHTTKYTLLTFLPYFFMAQLSQPANIFFCLILIIQVTNSKKGLRVYLQILLCSYSIRLLTKSSQQFCL